MYNKIYYKLGGVTMKVKILTLSIIMGICLAGCGTEKTSSSNQNAAASQSASASASQSATASTQIENALNNVVENATDNINKTAPGEVDKNVQNEKATDERTLDDIVALYTDAGYKVDTSEKPYYDMIGAVDGVMFYIDNKPVKIYEYKNEAVLSKWKDTLDSLPAVVNGRFALETSNEDAINIFNGNKDK